MLYRLWPTQRVFIDSQSDFYGEALTRQYAGIIHGDKNWDAELDQYDVRWIIIPLDAGLTQKALTSADWQIVYEDSGVAIFDRK